jgi:N-acyl-L-homoserine lactone synthetase
MTEQDATFAVGDAIAAEILASLEPFRFAEATDEAAMTECFRLRHRALLEFDPAAAGVCPDAEELDEFDADAVQLIGRDHTRAIATSRLVLPSPGRLLPVEGAFGLEVSSGGRVVEWGRVVVDPAYRGDGHSVFMGLAAQGWVSMRARGYAAAIGATPERLVGLFEALGFAVTVLGPPRRYWGEERVPILCGALQSIERLETSWRTGEAGTSPAPDGPNARAGRDAQ